MMIDLNDSSGTSLRSRFEQIEALLLALAPIWQPQPFKEYRPPWCQSHREMTEALLALDEAGYRRLFQDEQALLSYLETYLPGVAGLRVLTQLPQASLQTTKAEAQLDWEIPGRKWQQIDRFARAMGEAQGPLLEWCGGKGHLGRVLARRKQVPVTTLERDAQLCLEGERLAGRARVRQLFQRVDVLSSQLPSLAGLHPVALHACGELHRNLVRRVLDEGLQAVDIAPCCYHLGSTEHYQPFSKRAKLKLRRDDLRLAVTGNATASAREVRQRDREMAWKLGFIELCNHLRGESSYLELRPVDKHWLKRDFAGFCRALAGREGTQLAGDVDWSAYEALGWRRQGEVMRLSLPRHAIRRALELWLVLDMALALHEGGYEVRLQSFCAVPVSPRNILLSARRRGAP